MAGRANEPLPLQRRILPSPVGRNRKDANRGGYDCDFVNPPPEAFQTQCPVCLQILKEPCLISCCGNKYCRECIERVKKDAKPCPLCKELDFTFMQDVGLERSLNELEVWCSHEKEGCEWRGELQKLNEHVNQDPSPESQLNGCEYAAVTCIYKCGEWFQRRHIAIHQNEQCLGRPYTCDYCQDYTSTFNDVTEIHYLQCGKYPVACPNDCGVDKMEQQDLEGHLRDKCPLALVDCPFHYAGCETKLPRKNLPEHMEDTVTHVIFLATLTQRLSAENQKVVQENQQLKWRVLEREDQSHKSVEAVRASFQKLMDKNQEFRQSTAVSIQKLNMKYESVVTLKKPKQVMELQRSIEQHEKEKNQQYRELLRNRRITDDEIRALKEEGQNVRLEIEQHKNTSGKLLEFRVKFIEETMYSPAFYTHPHGYRMCIRVDPKGHGMEKGTHVSIFTFMMRGPFDNHLIWPFRGDVTIQIVNQAGDHDHVEKITSYNDDTPDKYAGRVTNGERSIYGWGKHQFLSHADLGYNAARKTQYLKVNYIIIRVVKVVLM